MRPLRAVHGEPGEVAAAVTAVPVAASAVAVAPLSERILKFQATVLSHDTFAEAAAAFATEVAATLQFDRAALGFWEGGRARVVATSHTADFEARAALFSAFAAAMEESLDQESTVTFPERTGTRPLVMLAHAALARRYGGAACTVPLVSRGRAFGALTLVREAPTLPNEDELHLCEHLACIVGPILELKFEAERAWHDRLTHVVASRLRKVAEPGHTRTKIAAGVAAALCVALLAVPVPYRIGAHARVEGAVQRALVAPADGFLRHVHARPGDTVKADQVLAELAEDDMRLEHRKWQSELTQHENAASAALARGDRAQYVINQSKADEARAQLDLVERQLSRGRVVAPFDGVVIKGDLTQSLGAPVKRGDVLLTVAPSDRFRLLIEVDERDIGAVAVGRRGSVALGALTERSLAFRVARVTPVSSNRDARNFFEVEGELEEGSALLRPGLQGVAKIDAGYQPLAWIWTHRLFDWMRMTLWSWGL
jgi:biotin carboxyl carrier protein